MIEKEVNLKINDYNGLVNYLNNLGVANKTRVAFHYFNKKDSGFFTRIEEKQDGLFITLKSLINKDEPVKIRKEITTQIYDLEAFIDIFQSMGMMYSGRKSKIRTEYIIDDLIIDLDDWYTEKFDEFIESRLEIEGTNVEKILGFADKIKGFASITTEDLKK
ncbi:MAG: hypothetical protein PHS92_00010 [Candidatus Gracilibacteria bacterium]|nr:hypothetical protein [Candidatus Gracilibacteria bacterium]